ncbi:hypothetical protein KEM55_002819 [Ascosphaera atra]|nr:hypothetical protein KEM55_002819 [Ascosphaera atra]
MSKDRTTGRNVFFFNGTTGEALGGLEQQGSITEANLLWILERILLVCDAPFRVINSESKDEVKHKNRAVIPGKYGIYSEGTISLTDEPSLPRISSSYSVSGGDNNFRDAVRARDGRCVVSGIVNHLASRGRWDSFEVAHVFPLEWESVWTEEKYGRWVNSNVVADSIAQINSPQNGILLTSNLRRWFDQYLFSINPDVRPAYKPLLIRDAQAGSPRKRGVRMLTSFQDNYKVTVFCTDIFKIDGLTLQEVCRKNSDPNRVSDAILRWHFRQAVLANMRGVGEPTFETDFPPGSDKMSSLRHGPYGKERLEKALEMRMRWASLNR